MTKQIAFQGELGAYGHQACHQTYPEMTPLPCATFEAAIEAVRSGKADLGMIAVENSTYGRVADVHHLLPDSGLHIIDEAFVRVHINLLGQPGARLEDIRVAAGHTVILPQCAGFLRQHGITTEISSDNARAARDVAEGQDSTRAALASEMAAGIYGLEVLARNIEDHDLNTTRFLVMSREADLAPRGDRGMMTSFIFRLRSIPAALYKALGGFATNGVNMIKLESYIEDGKFQVAQFYAEIEGHPDDRNVQLAFEELEFFTTQVTLLGVYPANEQRFRRPQSGG